MDDALETGHTAGADHTGRPESGLTSFLESNHATRHYSDCSSSDGCYLSLPRRVSVPVPDPSSDCTDQPEHQAGLFWQQLSDVLGIELASVDPTTREACVVKSVRLFKRCLSGLQRTLKARSERVDELEVGLSKTACQRVRAFEGASVEAIMKSLLRDEQAPLLDTKVISRVFRELEAHEASVLAGCRAMAHAAVEHFSPQQLVWQFEHDRGKPWILTDARRWRDYVRHHQDLTQSDTWSKTLLAKNFASAYEQQFPLIANFYHD
ncbi:hypothetical protein NLO72_13970 [Pseudomonas tremae]|uniref:type VI secretion system-associated FHA domain protein n=1 Tax=Pseudomonas syringae group TaxID=136849 RepID=UPI000F1036A1|nr:MULTISPECIES: type VI secretion system-associated FHA domain protein [Pseudomonas syringae group]MCQ2990329.1 hypothetical protein [Pseudomonas tremae]RMV62639.1 hypothetical protein ALP06_00933 [Pseudomonas coronafaciens pv. atropurpurea]